MMVRRPGLLLLVAMTVCAMMVRGTAAQEVAPDARGGDRGAFAEAVDLSPFDHLAVQVDGRLKSFESFVRGEMQLISGPRSVRSVPPGFTYLDLMLRTEAYTDADVIYVKKKPMRRQIAEALADSPARMAVADFDARMERFIDTGLIAERLLMQERVRDLLSQLSRNLVTTAKYVEMIEWALTVKQPQRLRARLRVVPPPGGGFSDPWLTLDQVTMAAQGQGASGVEPALEQRIAAQWLSFVESWRAGDASGVNAAAAQLEALLPEANPELYPDQTRLAWESWYFKTGNMTWVWMIYLGSVVLLLLAVVYRWPAARWLGLAVFLIAFGLQTFAVMLRWYVASRWPNSNMFEAVTTAAWFGGCLAVVLEIVLGRTPMRNLFALCSAVGSMVALMAAHFMPLTLNPNIGNMMPVLHDVWLYIHTNVIIFSYCLIFMAAVSAALYLLYRLIGRFAGFSGPWDYAPAGGAASLIASRADGPAEHLRAKTSFGQVLDGVTMVLMELSFIMLWAGIVMGAIWADHSWGRPWGWDPKEVFALNTFIIFIILIHGRLKMKDKGLWTAWMAFIGCAVMLFNWIVVNFVIVGLHSYA